MPRTITALFDTVRAAGRAAYDLGTRVGGVRVEVFGARTSGAGGLGALPREEAGVLADGIRPGGGVVRETAGERVETVSDTVRRTGVEVEDHRGRTGAATPAGATGTPGRGPGAA